MNEALQHPCLLVVATTQLCLRPRTILKPKLKTSPKPKIDKPDKGTPAPSEPAAKTSKPRSKSEGSQQPVKRAKRASKKSA